MKARNHLQYPFTVSIATFACLLACSSEDSRPATPKPAADAATDAATQNDAQSGTDSGSAADDINNRVKGAYFMKEYGIDSGGMKRRFGQR